MAARRPPAQRTRANTNTTTIQVPRPPSRAVMSKSTTSSRDEAQDVETNIQVVIRCRRRSEREIHDNSPIIVSSSGAKSHEVTIESSVPVSSLGVVTLPPTKTYPFDLVFGPEADQAMIYHEVVGPMLSEVLQGYNCTLFAYGQTGTGKTYVSLNFVSTRLTSLQLHNAGRPDAHTNGQSIVSGRHHSSRPLPPLS
jgi:kinesin family member 11